MTRLADLAEKIPELRVPCQPYLLEATGRPHPSGCRQCGGLGYTLVSDERALWVLLEWCAGNGWNVDTHTDVGAVYSNAELYPDGVSGAALHAATVTREGATLLSALAEAILASLNAETPSENVIGTPGALSM